MAVTVAPGAVLAAAPAAVVTSIVGGCVVLLTFLCLFGMAAGRRRRARAAPAVRPADNGFLAEELGKLADLRDRGALSDDEFSAGKERLLSGTSNTPAARVPPAPSEERTDRAVRRTTWATLVFALLTVAVFVIPLGSAASFEGAGNATPAMILLVLAYTLGGFAAFFALLLLVGVLVCLLRRRWRIGYLLGAAVASTVLAGLIHLVLLVHGLLGAVAHPSTAVDPGLVRAAKTLTTVFIILAIAATVALLLGLLRARAGHQPLRASVTACVVAVVWVSALAAGLQLSASGHSRVFVANLYTKMQHAADTVTARPVDTGIGSIRRSSGVADDCQAGYGYLNVDTNRCYRGTGPNANNRAGDGTRAHCATGFPYFNAGTGRCYTSIPSLGGTRRSGSNEGNGVPGSARTTSHQTPPGTRGVVTTGSTGPSTVCSYSSAPDGSGGTMYTAVTVSGTGPCYLHVTEAADYSSSTCYATDYKSNTDFPPPPDIWNLEQWDETTAYDANGNKDWGDYFAFFADTAPAAGLDILCNLQTKGLWIQYGARSDDWGNP